MIPNFENIKINIQALYTRSPVHIMPLISAFPALLVPAFCRAFARFSRRPEGSPGLCSLVPCTRRPWLAHVPGFRTPSKALRACSDKLDLSRCPCLCGAALCQWSVFWKFRKNSGLLPRLRTQPVPLWAFLNFRGQRYGEYSIYANISASFFKLFCNLFIMYWILIFYKQRLFAVSILFYSLL